ncbi:hypothetical protein CCUS01_13269 [Colletotrichum cuscutae]|uniref:Uncharacterized protein n=1 Tax=Colletotrichum cuscutae TaxID=1209917 RepID=A0AAI9YC93_9PEZI|nr:hypothetical protein CCUS01_13269 [Colletotrichum cuscutae]
MSSRLIYAKAIDLSFKSQVLPTAGILIGTSHGWAETTWKDVCCTTAVLPQAGTAVSSIIYTVLIHGINYFLDFPTFQLSLLQSSQPRIIDGDVGRPTPPPFWSSVMKFCEDGPQ